MTITVCKLQGVFDLDSLFVTVYGVVGGPSTSVQRGYNHYSFTLVTDDISDTFQFADFPFRDEEELSTADFIQDFPRFFSKGPPNAAITFVSSDDEDMALATPLVAIFSNPKMVGGGISYDIEQSPNQDDVLSIESLFTNGKKAKFLTCSIFIDDASVGTVAVCTGICASVLTGCEEACLASLIFPPAYPACAGACAAASVICVAACSA